MANVLIACLSVRDPWARAMFYHRPLKDVENRTWYTHYRGDLLIHVSLKSEHIAELERRLPQISRPGHIIGVVTLTKIIEYSKSKWAQPNQYHWCLENPRPFKMPIPYKGQMGLFYVPRELMMRGLQI